MRRFRFRLTPLLRLRAQLERQSRRELATAMAAMSAIDQRLAAAEQGLRDCELQSVRTDAVGQLAKALDAGLRRHRWRLQKEQKDAQQRLDVVRADYATRARELKTLQNLRDQKKAVWRQDVARQEQAELDELSAMARSAQAIAAQPEGEVR
jgi:flagellar export protein FliJ